MTTSAIARQCEEERSVAFPASRPGGQRPTTRRRTSASDPERPQMLRAIETRIAGLETRVEQATAEIETGALVQLQQSFGAAIKQAQERMKHYANACGESRLVVLEAELERRLEPFLNRSQAAINDLGRLLDALRQERAAWETRLAQRHQQDGARHSQDPVDLRLQRLSESLRREGRHA